jgi:hypothetical protein
MQVTFRSSSASPGVWKGEFWIFLEIIVRMLLWFFLGRKPKSDLNDVEFGEADADDHDDDSDGDDHED